MKIAIAAPHEVDAIWPRLAEGMQHACERSGEPNEFTAGELWQLCRAGQAFLILAFDGPEIFLASIWQFQSRNGRPVFRCLMMFGKQMKTWADDVKTWVSDMARNNGAVSLIATGRRGWLRYFGAAQCGDDYEMEI